MSFCMAWKYLLGLAGMMERQDNTDGAEPRKSSEQVLYCDDPVCGRVIPKNVLEVAFNRESGEFYHKGECGTGEATKRAYETGSEPVFNFDYIPYSMALILLEERKAKQSELERIAS